LRALNKFKTDGLKKTWKRGDHESSSENFIENFYIKPSLVKNQMTHLMKEASFKSKEKKTKKINKLKNSIDIAKTLNGKKVNDKLI
jgi:ribosomal protein L9